MLISTSPKKIFFAMFLCLLANVHSNAQEKQKSTESVKEIADKLANPVSNLISVPFQSNLEYGIGSDNGSRYTLNFQPVIPIKLSSEINLITRTIIPIIDQRDVIPANESQTGIGDATLTAFFSPSKKGRFMWGAGPAFLVPIATDRLLGSQKFGVGPSALVVRQKDNLTVGILANQIWSVAGNSNSQDISQLFCQTFLNYSFVSGATVGGVLEIGQNWRADITQVTLTPTVGGVTRLGKQVVQMVIGPRIPLSGASGQKADFGLRATIAFVFPK